MNIYTLKTRNQSQKTAISNRNNHFSLLKTITIFLDAIIEQLRKGSTLYFIFLRVGQLIKIGVIEAILNSLVEL